MNQFGTAAQRTQSIGGQSGALDAAGAAMVFEMRLLLSVAALMALFLAPGRVGALSKLSWLTFAAYALYSATLFLAAKGRRLTHQHGKPLYWIDLLWYALMIYGSGGGNSFFVPFFFFVILTASFQWGFDDGARVTLASAALLCGAALALSPKTDLGRLLLRLTFVLGLGYMIAYWGGLSVAQRRRLALLSAVSRLSNPRFGVDQTVASLLEQTRLFYGASNCILLTHDPANDQWLLRSANAQQAGGAVGVSRLSAAAAAPLLAFPAQQTVLYTQAISARLAWTGEASVYERGTDRWTALDPASCLQLADLFDARTFISAPLPLRKGEGRIYVASASERFNRGDAVFLQHLSRHAFPMIETIELLDRLASDAAFRERQKIARDLHDTAVQPYVGLRHALGALRQRGGADNPLNDDLDKLIAMSTEVIGDMRNFARKVRRDALPSEPELLVALRRQAEQAHEFYGIALSVEGDPALAISDRLAAEVFQIVNEGMSNIRKHTRARAGRIHLARADDMLHIQIENDNPDHAAADFLPASIVERATALGGTVRIDANADGATTVRVAIPL
ncbi:histidine kinase [Rugamonas sp.]|uniref:sensor histidine kinase n=1 Tax=Rugamonas sp. TaxID=1926287 RepID=UPI0025D46D05|nr:histidine kinase [Rugamonas sp.]